MTYISHILNSEEDNFSIYDIFDSKLKIIQIGIIRPIIFNKILNDYGGPVEIIDMSIIVDQYYNNIKNIVLLNLYLHSYYLDPIDNIFSIQTYLFPDKIDKIKYETTK